MGEIKLENICKSFGTTKVIENLNLTIKDGEFAVLVGASGCGKTTLLRIIAGIGPATSGNLYIDGEEVSDLPPGERDIAMVFQNYAIYPTMTVRGNIEFGLINNKVPKAERTKLVEEVAEIVGLTPYLKRKPSELSGGQRQRVALARAMVKKPAVFLLDEPLSNLDAKLRGAMRSELIELHQRLGTTFVYVTHDQTEAMSMADTIVLLDKGAIQQIAPPSVMYHDPDNVFTAQFIGTPPMNIMPLGEKFLGYRPERVALDHAYGDGFYRKAGNVLTREMLGSETLYKVALENTVGSDGKQAEIMVKSADWKFKVGQACEVYVDKDDLYFFDSAKKRIREKENETVHRECMDMINRT